MPACDLDHAETDEGSAAGNHRHLTRTLNRTTKKITAIANNLYAFCKG